MAKKLLIMANILIVFAFIGVLTAFAQATDTTPPVITGVGATGIAQTTATINWITDEAADGQVEYGTSTAYGLLSPLITATTTAHHIALSSLTASSTYHFIVKSKDAAGNLATSTDYAFATLAAPVASSNLTVKLKVEPRVLNTGSRGNWIEAEVTFPRGTDIRTLEVASIKLNGAILPVKVKTTKQKWYESFTRKTPKAEMKFSRAEVIDLLLSGTVATSTTATASSTSPVIERQQRDLIVSGTIGGKIFAGTTSVYMVIRKGGIPPVIFQHKEEKEHRLDRVITATSTATTTAQITTSPPAVQKHKKDDDSIFYNPFSFITAPFAPIKKQQKEIKKENEKKEKKKDRD